MAQVKDMWLHPGPQPNGMQAVEDGLWIIDQTDNHLYKLRYEDGVVLERWPTETEHSSGVTVGDGYIWVASTYTCQVFKLDFQGRTVARYDTPGKGVVEFAPPGRQRVTGAHGLEWVDGRLWVAVPPAKTIYQIEPDGWEVLHSIPTPGNRPHGIAWDEGTLWCADTGIGAIHRLDPQTGQVLEEIRVEEPEVHGLTLRQGTLWFCCAQTRRVCTVTP